MPRSSSAEREPERAIRSRESPDFHPIPGRGRQLVRPMARMVRFTIDGAAS